MGKIWIDVLFGTKENCRCECLLFEVVDLESPYHPLLGRPALAKFMASTHLTYLKMKLPGPEGVITITGDYRKSLECSSAFRVFRRKGINRRRGDAGGAPGAPH